MIKRMTRESNEKIVQHRAWFDITSQKRPVLRRPEVYPLCGKLSNEQTLRRVSELMSEVL